MDNFLSDDTKAIILLCGILGKEYTVNPLTPTEYNALAGWLVRQELRPEALLNVGLLDEAADGANIDKIRLGKLLDRGLQLGFAIEEWQRIGLWVISRSDPEYPTRYKNHLREKAPPLLFGAGDKGLLQGGGLAIVGSRNVDAEGDAFTRQVAEECSRNRMRVVSGGARGVDQISMRSALESGGQTIGVLAENLLKASIERHARYAIAEGQLLLISPYHPKARFTVGTAMGRNKLIYAMADYGLVVSADHKKGGTWTGAVEELKRDKPIAVFVRTRSETLPAGNNKLLDLGALKWPEALQQENLFHQLAELAGSRPEPIEVEAVPETLSLFDFKSEQEPGETEESKNENLSSRLVLEDTVEDIPKAVLPETIYNSILPVILAHLGAPMTADDLSVKLEVAKGQLNVWLKKAVEDGAINKHSKPVRYSVKRGK